jgi:hypothetical protein
MGVARGHADCLQACGVLDLFCSGARHRKPRTESVPIAVPHVALNLCFRKQGSNQERLSKRSLSCGKTGSWARLPGCITDLRAATASVFRSTVRALKFLVFVRSIARRSRWTCPHLSPHCSERRIPV